MKLVLNAKELAEALSMRLSTIHQYSSKQPDRLPPRLTGSRRLRWAVKDVEEWVESRRQPEPPAERFET